MIAQARGINWITLADGQGASNPGSGAMEVMKGDMRAEAHGKVEVNGTVKTESGGRNG